MLILSRKKDESILIGDNIKITIVDFRNNLVRVGIEAPKDLTILREELVGEVAQENLKALDIDVDLISRLPKLFTDLQKKDESEG